VGNTRCALQIRTDFTEEIMTDPTVNQTDDVAADTTSLDGELADLGRDEAEASSARARAQRRLTRARSSVSDATVRARRSAKLPTPRKTETTEDGGPSALSTVVERVQAYRTYVLGAAAALVALIAVARKRSSAPQVNDSVDLGDWHLRADPLEEEA
jgi:hypothetical protein